METIIALTGNPNSGKTTLFNSLTGARQHVGNYPGITVEKKEGVYKSRNYTAHIIDLPGTYSLTSYSHEEMLARNFITDEKPNIVINIIDASNLERNLYLTIQFLELGIPVCIALNMMDVAKQRGIEIDSEKLSEILKVPVVQTIARKGKGKKELMDAAIAAVIKKDRIPFNISYGNDIDNILPAMEEKIITNKFLTDCYLPKWVALKYLEKDKQIMELGENENPDISKELCIITAKIEDHLHKTLNSSPEAVIADHRYGHINYLVRQGIIKYSENYDRPWISDKIDNVLTHRFIGPLIMLSVLMGLYQFTFTYSEMPVGWAESFFGWLGERAEALMPDGLIKSLLISGIIDGIGGVMGFVPLIMFMFFGIAFLEDTGYLARVAYMLDRVFRTFGLHGSSVMSFIISGGIAGGCAVPGIMATRTLISPKEKLATLLTAPFMNCGAKLPVFLLLIAAFFSENEASVMFGITLVSWAGALITAKLLRVTVIKGESTPFVMELPPYRFPTVKGLLIHTWERTWQYIKKAGTVILGISVILWAMMTFPGLPESSIKEFNEKRQVLISGFPIEAFNELEEFSPGILKENHEFYGNAENMKKKLMEIDSEQAELSLRYSLAGRIGTAFEPISQLAGFDWRTNIALTGGFAAKEVVVSTLGTAHSLGHIDSEKHSSLSEKLADTPGWSPLTALSLIIFTMFYAPCFVAVVCIARESGSWKWCFFSITFNTLSAFSLAVLVFQTGSMLGY